MQFIYTKNSRHQRVCKVLSSFTQCAAFAVYGNIYITVTSQHRQGES